MYDLSIVCPNAPPSRPLTVTRLEAQSSVGNACSFAVRNSDSMSCGRRLIDIRPPLTARSRYYEVEVLTSGFVRIGWAKKSTPSDGVIGSRSTSYALAVHQVSS